PMEADDGRLDEIRPAREIDVYRRLQQRCGKLTRGGQAAVLHIEDAVHEDRDRVALEDQAESIATTIVRIGWAASAPRCRERSRLRTTEDRGGALLEMLTQIL